MSIVERLTENIVSRDLQKEGQALRNKWEATGLLEGLDDDMQKNGMSVLLENQAKELLREVSTMQMGDVEGFAAVAFPIVRRVFGGLIANKLVSVQPMSLPSGLIFFLDFTRSNDRPGADDDAFSDNDSLYGGGVVASELADNGANLSGSSTPVAAAVGSIGAASAGEGFYHLNSGYSSPTSSVAITHHATTIDDNRVTPELQELAFASLTEAMRKAIRYDPDILAHMAVATTDKVGSLTLQLDTTEWAKLDKTRLGACVLADADGGILTHGKVVRRLTTIKDASARQLRVIVIGSTALDISNTSLLDSGGSGLGFFFPVSDSWTGASATGGVVGTQPWPLEGSAADGHANIAEIDIKVDSIAVTAQTKKLKAKWTPELGQDLNAYHNLDAEVELTSILSETIALEIDKEILRDLVSGATAGTYFWSRAPGDFRHRTSGAKAYSAGSANPPDFTGTVSEWYETLLEVVNDLSAAIHRKVLRGGANFLVCGPEVASLLEMTSGFRASIEVDADKGSAGAVKVGSVSKKWEVYTDPYFPRNVILVGRKGNSFLESGYVYAPYVPLQVTPTIFGVEDFVPRKGVMTRYAKKMVRPDMYGVVVVQNMFGDVPS